MPRINEDMRYLVISKHIDGKSMYAIAKEMGMCYQTVRKICQKFAKTESVKDIVKSGRPKKTSERERRHICILSKEDPFKTASNILNEAQTENAISSRTVRRILQYNGLFGRISKRKILISNKNKKKRLQFSLAYKNFSPEFWNNIIFSDEILFKLFSVTRKYVRRPIGKRHLNRYVTKSVRQCTGSILVWGAIKQDGTRSMVRCWGRLNSAKYQSVLTEGLLSIYNTSNIFVQDGASCHRSISTMEYLNQNSINVLSNWPPQSPDCNIIENVWSVLKTNVFNNKPRSSFELWKYIQEEWQKIPTNLFKRLYSSIPARLNEIRKSRGGVIKY